MGKVISILSLLVAGLISIALLKISNDLNFKRESTNLLSIDSIAPNHTPYQRIPKQVDSYDPIYSQPVKAQHAAFISEVGPPVEISNQLIGPAETDNRGSINNLKYSFVDLPQIEESDVSEPSWEDPATQLWVSQSVSPTPEHSMEPPPNTPMRVASLQRPQPLYQGSRSNVSAPENEGNPTTAPMIESQTAINRAAPPAPSISSNSRYVSPIESLSPAAPSQTIAPPGPRNSNNFLLAKSKATNSKNGPQQDSFEQQPMENPAAPPMRVTLLQRPQPPKGITRGSIYMPPSNEDNELVNEVPFIMAPGCPICGTPMPINGASCPVCTNAPACDSCGGQGCPDCGIAGNPGNPTSGCATCGAGGCYNPNAVAEQFGDCGSVSQARGYFVAEALYLNRRDGIIANSNFGALSNFDWAAGLHLTVGRRRDSISGRELSYFGTDEITEDVRHFDAQGRIDARFNAGDGFLASEITAFKNAVEQVESKQTELHSLEFNKVEWGWDVVKTYVGLRYLYIEDSYQMASRNVFNEQGLFEVYVKNNLIGPNWGTEVYYDVGSRLSATFIARGGLYGSISKVRTKLNNNGTQILNVEDDNSTIGGTLEFGVNGRFKIARRANLRFGYNLMLISRVAEASNNVPRTITPSIGAATSNTNDMQFHGANIGFEIYR